MTESHQVIFYPVGNGDCSQIILANERRLLFDYRHTARCEDEDAPEIDLQKRLFYELAKAGRDNFDVVAFTHADDDHISGSTDFFWLRYNQEYQGDDRIKIDELWVPAAMLIETAAQDEQGAEFVILRQEARYRLLEGEGIRVFSKPQALMDWLVPKLEESGLPPTARDHLFVDAGTLVPGFTLLNDGIEFFCHSPFVKHSDEGEGPSIRNIAALIFSVRFSIEGNQYDYIAIGDSEWQILEEIVEITQGHGNDERLCWNLFNIPHHCSYLALSDEKGEQETEPKTGVKTWLHQGQPDAYMISSSLPIPNSQDARNQTQPPHIQARKAYERYLRVVGGRKLLVTMEEPNINRPKPIVLDIGASGITWNMVQSGGAAAIITSRPSRAGYTRG